MWERRDVAPRVCDNTARYISLLWAKERAAVLKMTAAEKEWNLQSDGLDDWLDKMGIIDKAGRTKVREENVDLASAYNAWNLWRGQVIAFAAAIQAERDAAALLGVIDKERPGPPGLAL